MIRLSARLASQRAVLTLALGALLLAMLAGTRAAQAETFYDCTWPHCYGQVTFFHSGNLSGFRTAISTVHMEVFCQSSCIDPPRFLTNEAWLLDNDNHWVEVGMAAVHRGTTSRMIYVWADRRPNHLYILHRLGEVPDEDIGQSGWYIIKRVDSTTFSITIANGNTYFSRLSKHNTMTPIAINLGQELHGTELVGEDGPATHSQNGFFDASGVFHYETGLGVLTSDDPPHAFWQVPPSQSATGGVLQTDCCFTKNTLSITSAPVVTPPSMKVDAQNQPSLGEPAILPTSRSLLITEDQVRQYLSASTLSLDMNPITKETAPTLSALKLLSAGELSKLLDGEDLGVAADAPLWYVELQGSFAFAAPGGKSAVTYTRGFEVFDAHTGNLLLSGGLE